MAKSGFAAEFAKQRAKLGAGKTFTYNGKTYSTNRADDKPAAKPAAKPAGMTSSLRPQPRPTAAAKPATSTPASTARNTPMGSNNANTGRVKAMNEQKAMSSSGKASVPPSVSMRPKPRPTTTSSGSGSDDPQVTMYGAMKRGGAVVKPSMAMAMKKYEGSAADKKADMAGAKKMMGKGMGKGMPPFMKGKK